MHNNSNYIFEFNKKGNVTKVSIVCTISFVEISVLVPSHMNVIDMQTFAIKKLNYVKKNKLNFAFKK